MRVRALDRARGRASMAGSVVLSGSGMAGQVAGAEPTAANTGPAAGTSFTTHAGDLILNDGDNLSGLHVTGNVWQRGSNCSLTNCLVEGNIAPASFSPGTPASSATNLTLTHVKATTLSNVGGFDGLTITSCWFGTDGLNDTVSQLVDSTTRAATGLVCRNSYFYGRPSYAAWKVEHGLGPGEEGDPHWEAAHWVGVQGFDVTNTVFDIQPKNGPSDTTSMGHITAAMTFENSWTGSGRQCSGTFNGNHLYGGGYYQIYLNLVGGSTFNDNAFHSNTGSTPYTIAIANPSFTASGNTLDGQPYSITY